MKIGKGCGVVLAIAALSHQVAPSRADSGRRFEITPILGYRGGATLEASTPGDSRAEADEALSWGLTASWFVRSDAWIEVFVDRQTLEFEEVPAATGSAPFEVTDSYLHVGGGYEPQDDGPRPYVTVALGVTHLDADPGSVSDSIGLSGSAGVGIKVPLSRKALFRLEGRGWWTFTDSAAWIRCGPGCAFELGANGWWQFGVLAGIGFRP